MTGTAGTAPPDWTDERKRLSSAWTPVTRYVFPGVWITGFGIGTLIELARAVGPAPPHQLALGLILATVWLGGSAALIALSRISRTVVLERDALVVTGFRRTVRVPLSAVVEVAVPGWNMDLVRVTLKQPGRQGSRFYFLARVVLTRHPVTALQTARLLQATLPVPQPEP